MCSLQGILCGPVRITTAILGQTQLNIVGLWTSYIAMSCEHMSDFLLDTLLPLVCTNVLLFDAPSKRRSYGDTFQVKQELQNSDGIVAECQLLPRCDDRRRILRINVETQILKIQNKINKYIMNIMNVLDHLFQIETNYL